MKWAPIKDSDHPAHQRNFTSWLAPWLPKELRSRTDQNAWMHSPIRVISHVIMQVLLCPGSLSKYSETYSRQANNVSIIPNGKYEPRHDKTNKMTVRPAKTDQPWHPPSLIRVFAVRMKKHWTLSYPLSAQGRLWSDLADAQANLSLRWAHTHCVGFVVSWLNYYIETTRCKTIGQHKREAK